MDPNEYLPMFLAECREHLQELSLAVMALEKTPEDREKVNEVFRIAHSLKGMSATMGFVGMAELTHAMEDVFELLRQRRDGLERKAVDALLECMDALSAAVDAIDRTGAEEIDPAALVMRLRSLVRARRSDQLAPAPPILLPTEQFPDGVTVAVTLDDDVAMPSVRAYMVLAALAEHGEILASLPPEDGLDDFDGRFIEVVLRTEHEDPALLRAAGAVEGVAQVTIVARGGQAVAASEPAAATEQPGAGDVAVRTTPDGAPEATRPRRVAVKRPTSTVRVDAERLDRLMGVMGELILQRTQLEALISETQVPGLTAAMQELTRSSHELRDMVLQVRMIEVEAVFLRLPRLVRDLSAKLGKEVELHLSGTEVELDRAVVDALGDPLVHLVRNALDHGMEPPQERIAHGKSPTGTLEIAAAHAGSRVVITVRDDGRGVDRLAVRDRARERGLIGPHEEIDMQRATELLFEPGFSTKVDPNDISGRGVGMDAVRATVQSLGGEITVATVPGEGTTTTIRLPLTLAILSALLVEVGGEPFAVPLDRVQRTLRLEAHPVHMAAGRPVISVEEELLPIGDAAALLGRAPGGESFAVIVQSASGRRSAIAVGRVIGQRELVTRPLPVQVEATPAVSGAALLSTGGIALVLDCDTVVEQALGGGMPELLSA